MANPTSRVQSGIIPIPDSIYSGKWPLVNTARTYQNGQMLGVLMSGYAADFDDTVAMRFLGLVKGHNVQVDSGGSNGDKHIDYYRPKRFTMPLVTGTASRATDLGKPVWAANANAGAVALSVSGLTVANLVGHITDVIGSTPEALTGSQVEIEPAVEQGLVVASINYSAPVDQAFFIADRPYIVRGIVARPRVVGSDGGAVTAEIRRAGAGVAPASGTILHTGAIDLKGTVDTNQELTLHGTVANLIVAKGEALVLDPTGTVTAATGTISVFLQPI